MQLIISHLNVVGSFIAEQFRCILRGVSESFLGLLRHCREVLLLFYVDSRLGTPNGRSFTVLITSLLYTLAG